MRTTRKPAAEWLLHFPPDIRKRVVKERKKYWPETGGDWTFPFDSLYNMLFCSMPGILEQQRLDPYWNDVYKRIEAGEFDKPWVKTQTNLSELKIGSKVKLKLVGMFLSKGTVIAFTKNQHPVIEWENGEVTVEKFVQNKTKKDEVEPKN